jgi:hypothetical protein
MLFQMIKAALIIAFLMVGWVSLQYIVRKKKKLTVDCEAQLAFVFKVIFLRSFRRGFFSPLGFTHDDIETKRLKKDSHFFTATNKSSHTKK